MTYDKKDYEGYSYKKKPINWKQWVVQGSIFALIWAVLAGTLFIILREGEPLTPAPCSDYANKSLQHLPAKCLKEFNK